MLLAEELLLLLTDPETGKLLADGSTYVDPALGGAMLVELAISERLDVAEPGDDVKAGRLVVRDPSPTGDPLLDAALAVTVEKQGSKPEAVLPPLVKGLRADLQQRLVAAGVLSDESTRVLGIFPSKRFPERDGRPEAQVRDRLVGLLVHGRPADVRSSSLLSLLQASRTLTKVFRPESPEMPLRKKELEQRATAVADADWATAATKKAIQAI